MARLILVHEGAVLKEYALDKERLTIGRKPSNDVQLDDPTVSGQHAVVLNLQNVYVEDMGSTNGTLLNGKRINKRMLTHGDVIKIGRHEFKYADEKAADFEKTVVISADVVDALRNSAKGAAKQSAQQATATASPQAEVATATKPAAEKIQVASARNAVVGINAVIGRTDIGLRAV